MPVGPGDRLMWTTDLLCLRRAAVLERVGNVREGPKFLHQLVSINPFQSTLRRWSSGDTIHKMDLVPPWHRNLAPIFLATERGSLIGRALAFLPVKLSRLGNACVKKQGRKGNLEGARIQYRRLLPSPGGKYCKLHQCQLTKQSKDERKSPNISTQSTRFDSS